jgi:hypothetical protein
MLSSRSGRKFVSRLHQPLDVQEVSRILGAIQAKYGDTIQDRTQPESELYTAKTPYPVHELLPVKRIVPVMIFTENEFGAKAAAESALTLPKSAVRDFAPFGETRLTYNFRHRESPLEFLVQTVTGSPTHLLRWGAYGFFKPQDYGPVVEAIGRLAAALQLPYKLEKDTAGKYFFSKPGEAPVKEEERQGGIFAATYSGAVNPLAEGIILSPLLHNGYKMSGASLLTHTSEQAPSNAPAFVSAFLEKYNKAGLPIKKAEVSVFWTIPNWQEFALIAEMAGKTKEEAGLTLLEFIFSDGQPVRVAFSAKPGNKCRLWFSADHEETLRNVATALPCKLKPYP